MYGLLVQDDGAGAYDGLLEVQSYDGKYLIFYAWSKAFTMITLRRKVCSKSQRSYQTNAIYGRYGRINDLSPSIKLHKDYENIKSLRVISRRWYSVSPDN